MTRVTLGKSRVREIRPPGSVRAKAEWLSYSTTTSLSSWRLTARLGLANAHPWRQSRPKETVIGWMSSQLGAKP